MGGNVTLTLARASAFLEQGQALEARGDFTPALSAYECAVSQLRAVSAPSEEERRVLGVVWMNCGNALQKRGSSARDAADSARGLRDAIAAYDRALKCFGSLPFQSVALYRNHLGAAWLNRGHACMTLPDRPAAVTSFQQAIAHLRELPREEDMSFRLNYAGATTNLAHALFSEAENTGFAEAAPLLVAAVDAAREALRELADVERTHAAFAEMSLRARRALAVTLGALLIQAEARREPTRELASEASDAIDGGLALARECEAHGIPHFRPLAFRLFVLGAQLYRVHQPHFVGEFLLENVDPENPGAAFSSDPQFRAVADDALARTLAALPRPAVLVAGQPDTDRFVETARSLREAQTRLARTTPFSSST